MCSLVKKYILYLKPKIHINIIYLVPGPCHICDGQLRCVHTSRLCTWQIRKYNHAYTYTHQHPHQNTSFFMALPSMQCMTNVFSFVINVNEGCLKSFVIEACHSFSSLSDRQLLIKKSYFFYNFDYDIMHFVRYPNSNVSINHIHILLLRMAYSIFPPCTYS